ncbi:MAG: cytochrome c oxidase assembly protein [Gammaproteobacteria bacterium]
MTYNYAAAAKLSLLAVLMFGFGFAMVPLYYKFCEVTGINNLLAADEAPAQVLAARDVRIEFDVNSRAQISITPTVRSINKARTGESYSVIYTITNTSGRTLVGQAVPSYAPRRAAKWFAKIQCFCFDKLTLQKGEVLRAPVVFVVASELPEDIPAIALSYTFFEVEGAQ